MLLDPQIAFKFPTTLKYFLPEHACLNRIYRSENKIISRLLVQNHQFSSLFHPLFSGVIQTAESFGYRDSAHMKRLLPISPLNLAVSSITG